jgi:hypothetical protein
MGVSKVQCLTGTGALFTLAGGIVLGSFNGMQNFVLAEMQGVDACTENPIGSVGLFRSSLDFACTQTTGVPTEIQMQYASQVPLDSVPTVDYWPLFVSPNVFGFSEAQQAAIMNDTGLDNLDFNTCEEYHKAPTNQTNPSEQTTGGKGWRAVGSYASMTAAAGFKEFTDVVAPLGYTDFNSTAQNQALCGFVASQLPSLPATDCASVNSLGDLLTLANQQTIPAELQPLVSSMNTFYSTFASTCVQVGVTLVAQCEAAWTTPGQTFQAGLQKQVYDSLMSVNNTGTVYDTDIYINKCNNQLEDQDAVEKAQILVPIGTAVTLLGALVLIFGVAKLSKKALYAGSALGVIGAILGLVALLGVKGAPVFELVGLPVAIYDIHYETGTGSLLSLIGVVLGFLGPITATTGACLLKVETEHEVEVDAIEKVNSKV